jgi:hypothetical protein
MTLLETAIRLTKQAGAKREAQTARDGFLSYHAESHALALGLAAGWFAAVQGEMALLSAIYSAAVYGKASGLGDSPKRRRLLVDVTQEPHYGLAGVVAGALLGAVAGWAIGVPTRSPTELVTALPL